MNNKLKFIAAGAAVLVYCAPIPASAASPTPAASPKISSKAKATAANKAPTAETTTTKALPFHGTIATVDRAARSFTIAGKEKSRIFKVTETTVITKGGAPATFADLASNEEVRGNYVKAADGSMEVKAVKLGPKSDAQKAADEKRKTKKKEKESAAPSPSPSQ